MVLAFDGQEPQGPLGENWHRPSQGLLRSDNPASRTERRCSSQRGEGQASRSDRQGPVHLACQGGARHKRRNSALRVCLRCGEALQLATSWAKSAHFVSPDSEFFELRTTEGGADSDIRRITAAAD